MAVKTYVVNDEWKDINKANTLFAYVEDGEVLGVLLNGEMLGNGNITEAEATGTLANPWGDIDYDDLRAKLALMDASAYLTIDATALNAGTINSRPSGDSNGIFANGATMGTTASNTSAYGISWASDGSLAMAKMLSGGNVVDISSYASALPTNLYVIYHPVHK